MKTISLHILSVKLYNQRIKAFSLLLPLHRIDTLDLLNFKMFFSMIVHVPFEHLKIYMYCIKLRNPMYI